MRKGFLGSLVWMVLGITSASAQWPAYYGPPTGPYPAMYPPPMGGVHPVAYVPPPVEMPPDVPPSPAVEISYPDPDLLVGEDDIICQPDPEIPISEELPPQGFFQRPGPINNLRKKIRASMVRTFSLPPQSKGIVQTSVNGGDIPETTLVTEEELVEGVPNQPWIFDDQSGCDGEDCPAIEPAPDYIPYTPPGYLLYGSAEYLHWWIKEGRVPVLLSTGVLGADGTQVLIDDLDVIDNWERRGGRFTLGGWLDPNQILSLEGTYLFLGETDRAFSVVSENGPLYRPFFDANAQAETATILAAPGTQSGTFRLQEVTRLWSAEINLRNELARRHWFHFDMTLGGRFLEFDDGLEITDSSTYLAGPNAGSTVFRSDRFGARNQVYGGQIGFLLELHKHRWFINLWNKTLLGVNHQEMVINGYTLVGNPGGSPNAFPGGLLALPTNSGQFNRDTFLVMPEVGLNAGAQLTTHLRVSVGYTFLFLNNVLRPGEQIDRVINTTQLPTVGGAAPGLVGPNRPFFVPQESDFFAHGINGTLEFRY